MSSNTTSPASKSGSMDSLSRKSTPSTSPARESSVGNDKLKMEGEDESKSAPQEPGLELEDDDDEDMGHKSRALANLLKTSSVFVAIMADKMKKQQEQEAAKRAAARRKEGDAKAKAPPQATAAKKSTRSQANHETVEENEPQGKDNIESPSKQLPSRSRGRPKKGSSKKGIADYFQNEASQIDADGPSVRDALADAAEEFEEKPEGLGAQNLIATEQPALVTGGKMREYQLEGLEWLKSLWMNGLCGILADEMGLGKTIQAISMIAFFKEKNISGPFLIAAPLSTLRNWIDEFNRWTPSIETTLYHGSKDEREQMRHNRMKMQDQKKYEFPIVVTSYEICMNDKKFLANYQWRYIIVDEGHRLKNMNSKLIKELLTYNSANRLLITGTPLQNNITELWSLLHFLLPEVFNDVGSFQSWFDFSEVLEEKTDSDTKARNRKGKLVSTMHAILKPFLLRRIKTDVESNLPKKREYILYAPLTAEQKDLYREIIAGTSRSYLEEKAVERIEAKSRATSLKRKANSSGRSTPAKSLKQTRDSTPTSIASTGSTRRGRKAGRTNYKDVTDREFNAKLRRLEKGDDDVDSFIDDDDEEAPDLSSDEAMEQERTQTLKLAKKEIASKKLQNPIMQARLACNSPHNFYWPWTSTSPDADDDPEVDESLVKASGKLLLLDTLLPRLFKLKHKVLLFSQFKTTLDILETYAGTLRSWPTCRIDGSIDQTTRASQISSFNSPSSKTSLFLLSTRAGGQGINLASADTVILFDSDWNPQQDLQAMDRAHRIGQTKPVIVYRLATRGTVEETLLTRADGKRKLEKLVIQRGKFRSLLDGTAKSNASDEAAGAALHGVLASDDFEKHDVADDVLERGGQLLSEEELAILTDRSPGAYERAERGEKGLVEGARFMVAETRRPGEGQGGVLDDLTTRKGR